MLNVIICDDEAYQRELIKDIVDNVIMIDELDMEIILVTGNPYEVIEKITSVKNTGLYFLDVKLESDMDGLALAEEIRKYDPRGFIVFVSAYDKYQEFVLEHKLEPLEYIKKSGHDNNRNRIESCIRTANKRFLAQTLIKHDVLRVKSNGKIFSVEFKDIIYIATAGNKNDHRLILITQVSRYTWIGSLTEEEARLDHRFIKISQSYIVNTDFVIEYTLSTRTIRLKNNTELIVSRYKVNIIKKLLMEHPNYSKEILSII